MPYYRAVKSNEEERGEGFGTAVVKELPTSDDILAKHEQGEAQRISKFTRASANEVFRRLSRRHAPVRGLCLGVIGARCDTGE